jgi:predicted glycoside hydrolase/deacetylase ChbG (UPF0249 family)
MAAGPNPVLKRLGYKEKDRLVIIHLDDVGMCHASLEAYRAVLPVNVVSSASVMTPCGWFPATAAYCRQHPEVDMGVHITLTSEWDTYRWGPIFTRNPASGMTDNEGYFYRTVSEAQQNGDATRVRGEIYAQVQRALDAAIDVTHIDTHMGSVFHPKYIPIYVEAAQHYRVPCLFLRLTEDEMRRNWMFGDEDAVQAALKAQQELEARGFPLLDRAEALPLEAPYGADRLEHTKQVFAALQPGITHLMIHASTDTPELRGIAPDWQARVGDLEVFTNPELRAFIEQQGIHIIGYRALRDLIRGENG